MCSKRHKSESDFSPTLSLLKGRVAAATLGPMNFDPRVVFLRIGIGVSMHNLGNHRMMEHSEKSEHRFAALEYQFIDSKELALRWALPESWIRDQVRSRTEDPIPHMRFGKYVRFRWGSPELDSWAERRIVFADKGVERVPYKEVQ
jgi:hypothetical protein